MESMTQEELTREVIKLMKAIGNLETKIDSKADLKRLAKLEEEVRELKLRARYKV